MSGLRETCKCGHAKDTHFEKKHTCLAAACDCRRYRDENAADAAPETPRFVTVNPRPGLWIDAADLGRYAART